MTDVNSPKSFDSPPVIILGGGSNALSVARSLGREGVKVYALNQPSEHICSSRYAERIPLPGDEEADRLKFLLGPGSDHLKGAVLLACDDPGIELLARNREKLGERFLLDESDPGPQLLMLDKYATYKLADQAGVPTPKHWLATTVDDVKRLEKELIYPLLVKPFVSHVFQERFGKKFKVCQSFDELIEACTAVADARIECMLVEMLQGPDELCCSYYTYLDKDGNPLFDFTKRVYRRIPSNMGRGTFHKTEWNPRVRELSLKLLKHARLRGLACVEFRMDLKDNELKLIENNARFTAANGLVAASGFDLGKFVYNRLTGRPQPPMEEYKLDLSLWDPVEDLKAFLALRREGELSLGRWLRTIMRPHVMMYFAWDDPKPTILHEWREIRGLLGRRVWRVFDAVRRIIPFPRRAVAAG
jgi:predicted ATP-grasp superfamily ATP-dependent carboligase